MRNAIRSRVEGSAQWASSMIRTTGPASARCSSSVSICSNSRARATAGSASRSVSPNSGSSRANSRVAWVGSSAATPSAPRSRTSSLSTAANGANGRPSAPRSRQPPVSTRAPAAPAPAANSLTRRDLPIPASPPMSRVDGPPVRTPSRAESRVARCSARPTRTGLLMRALIPSRMPPVGDIPSRPGAAPLTADTASRRSRTSRLTLTGRRRRPDRRSSAQAHRPPRPAAHRLAQAGAHRPPWAVLRRRAGP